MTQRFSKTVKMSGVYEILHTGSGKRYIGSSKDINNRLRSHRSALRNNRHHSYHLQRAWQAYGENAFVFRPIIQCDLSDLPFYEQLVIDGYKAADRACGFNICPEVGTQTGKVLRPESREKMRKAALARVRTPAKVRYPKKTQEEYFAIRSRAAKGRKFPREVIERLAEERRGKPNPNGGRGWRERTHCSNGHPYIEGSFSLSPRPSGPIRRCRVCDKERMRAARKKAREKA